MTLVGGASLQSRAHRPIPPEWGEVGMLSRGPASEVWVSSHGLHQMKVTWVFDQGGPILGYTCEGNPLTAEHWLALQHVPFGPGGIASQWEWDAARLLVETVGKYAIGGGDGVRFFQNGSDACEAAIRIARAHTGRELVISIGYHGTSSTFAEPPQNQGASPGASWTARKPWMYRETTRHATLLSPPACVIVEVPSTDDGASEYLAELMNYCDRTGALLVLDEVATGFRLALGGAAEHYGVRADLLCYGKAMGNGRPISALVGRSELMNRLDRDTFYSNTYNGDPHSCAQVIATVRALQQPGVYARLYAVGEALREQVAGLGLRVVGHPTRSFFQFDEVPGEENDAYIAETKRRQFCEAMARRGVIVDRPNYASLAHTAQDIEFTAAMAKEVVEGMR